MRLRPAGPPVNNPGRLDFGHGNLSPDGKTLGARFAGGYVCSAMSLQGRKLGVLISARPDSASFGHGVKFAAAALAAGCDVYLYCIDDAVPGVRDGGLQALRGRGLKLYACAYGAHRRGVPVDDSAAFAGLTVVSDLVAGTDRFVSFN